MVRAGCLLKISVLCLLIRFQPNLHDRPRPSLLVEITGPPVLLLGPAFSFIPLPSDLKLDVQMFHTVLAL